MDKIKTSSIMICWGRLSCSVYSIKKLVNCLKLKAMDCQEFENISVVDDTLHEAVSLARILDEHYHETLPIRKMQRSTLKMWNVCAVLPGWNRSCCMQIGLSGMLCRRSMANGLDILTDRFDVQAVSHGHGSQSRHSTDILHQLFPVVPPTSMAL